MDRIPKDSCKLLTEKIMGAENYNFAPKYHKMSFQPFYFWTKILEQK